MSHSKTAMIHDARRLLGALLFIPTLFGACGDLPEPVDRDLEAVQETGELRVLFTYNPTGYFVYRGQPMGFEYSLLRQFAEEQGLELRPIVVKDRDELFHMLNQGEGDVVAASLVETVADSADVAYTEGLRATRPVLVQRSGPPTELRRPDVLEGSGAGEPGADDTSGAPLDSVRPRPDTAQSRPDDALPTVQVRARLVSRPAQLAGDTLHLPGSYPLNERIVELSDSLTGDITIVELEEVTGVEPLIARVARGELRFTASLEDVAQLQEEYYRNITVRPALGPTTETVWAVRRNADALLAALDGFIERARGDGTIDEAFQRYFEDREGFRERVASDYLTSETGQLSEYDALIKAAAPAIGWDWRLLASQAYQESRFDADARSWAGAMGLLQLMPATAQEVNVADPWDPEQNVQGAVRYLDWLTDQWDEIQDPEQKLRFVLASYNAGAGHVGDARRLAEKYGGDPNDWDDVAYWLVQKSHRRYYTDEVVRYGFCRGLEPVTYVSLILERYDHYRNFVPADGGHESAAPSATGA